VEDVGKLARQTGSGGKERNGDKRRVKVKQKESEYEDGGPKSSARRWSGRKMFKNTRRRV
jgi:hypothetical protein